MSELLIRNASADDSALIFTFIRELAQYEKAEHEVLADEEQIRSSLFGPESTTHALVCEKEHSPVGFAVYFFSYSTWLGKHGLYLEDLYITPSARGTGAGKTLLKHLAQIAVQRGCGRFEWGVLDWNEPAIRFYESFGAKAHPEWVKYRLSGQALIHFAET